MFSQRQIPKRDFGRRFAPAFAAMGAATANIAAGIRSVVPEIEMIPVSHCRAAILITRMLAVAFLDHKYSVPRDRDETSHDSST
jgi:hypothetical protein